MRLHCCYAEDIESWRRADSARALLVLLSVAVVALLGLVASYAIPGLP